MKKITLAVLAVLLINALPAFAQYGTPGQEQATMACEWIFTHISHKISNYYLGGKYGLDKHGKPTGKPFDYMERGEGTVKPIYKQKGKKVCPAPNGDCGTASQKKTTSTQSKSSGQTKKTNTSKTKQTQKSRK